MKEKEENEASGKNTKTAFKRRKNRRKYKT